MLKSFKNALFIVLLGFIVVIISSCKTGEGCPGENSWQKSVEMSEKPSKPKSGLFDKKTSKKMKK